VDEDYVSYSDVSTSTEILRRQFKFFTDNYYTEITTIHSTLYLGYVIFACIRNKSQLFVQNEPCPHVSVLWYYFCCHSLSDTLYKQRSHLQRLWIHHYLNDKD
jgi:hypothetical protein